jgi:predicted transcriptional regulator
MSHKKSAKIVTPDPDLARWCEALAAGTVVAEVVPPGWFTCKELSKARGRSECSTSTSLARMVESGMAEKRSFTIKLNTQTRPVPHYKLK